MDTNGNINKLFLPYIESLELKELGFDEPCLAYYTEEEYSVDKNGNKTKFILLSAKLRGELVGHGTVQNNLFKWLKDNDRTSGELYVLSNSVTAPTFSQAFKFFREKGYDIKVQKETDDIYLGFYWTGVAWVIVGCGTFEQAELECLRKLIEIVKNNVDKNN